MLSLREQDSAPIRVWLLQRTKCARPPARDRLRRHEHLWKRSSEPFSAASHAKQEQRGQPTKSTDDHSSAPRGAATATPEAESRRVAR